MHGHTHTHTLLGTHHIIRLHFQFTSESSQLWTSHMSLEQKWTYHTSAPHVITNDLYNTGTKKTFFKEEELNNKTDRYKWWLLVFLFCYCPIKSWSHGNEVLPQDTTQFIQRPCYQRGSPCQDPAGNWHDIDMRVDIPVGLSFSEPVSYGAVEQNCTSGFFI